MTGAAAVPTLLDRLLRPGRSDASAVRLDLWWLIGLACVLIGAGLGLRDPWPADEPRFALIARDMLATGDWLVPRVAADLYSQKPPMYFWLMAASMALTGSLRVGFLLPSLIAGIGTVLLVYDLLRRARGREVALAGALMLLLTFQFTWQARQAQIDATLCFLTTLSLYGLLRHLLVAPAPGWFVAGWAAAGLGVITKGVGFLPLLALIPVGVLAARSWPLRRAHHARRSRSWVPIAMLAAISIWFVPMWLATSAGGELLAYRNELLFHQTVTRYADPWHHREPAWYYLTNVIPLLWLPLIALVPWLWPRWRRALRGRDTLTAVLLAWVLIVIAFFSASSGKRGLYVLPAVPALAMAAAPWLPELLRARGPRRLAFTLAAVVAGMSAAVAAYVAFGGKDVERSPRGQHRRPTRTTGAPGPVLWRDARGVPRPRRVARVAGCAGLGVARHRLRDLSAHGCGPLGTGLRTQRRAARGRHRGARLRGSARAVCAAAATSDRLLWQRAHARSGARSCRRRGVARGGSESSGRRR